MSERLDDYIARMADRTDANIIADLRETNGQLRARAIAAEERLAEAEVALNGTPRTADGAAITDGTQLFRYVDGDLVTMQVKLCYVVPEDDNGLCNGATTWKFSEWYSSDEAAKAAV